MLCPERRRIRGLVPTSSLLTLACRILPLCVVSVMTVSVAGAQVAGRPTDRPPVNRPFRGLFGVAATDDRPQSLDFTATLGGAYDDNLTSGGQGQGSIDPRFQESGFYGTARAGLAYSRQSERLSLLANTQAGLIYIPEFDDYVAPTYRASVTLAKQVFRRDLFQFHQSAGYSPYFRPRISPTFADDPFGDGLSGLPGNGDVVVLDDADFALFIRRNVRLTTAATYARQFTLRSSLHFQYNFRDTIFLDDDTGLRQWAQRGGVRYLYQATRNARVHAGYGYRQARYGQLEEPIESHDLDLGVDYFRALSLTRRTTFTFGSGSAAVVRDRVDRDRLIQYRLLINAALDRQMGQSWTATLAYFRGFRFVEEFSEPFSSDSVVASLGGYFNRRVSFQSSAGYSTGSLSSSRRAFDTTYAAAMIQVALTRNLALYNQYFYYYYKFREGIVLPPGIHSSLDRRGVRVGLNLWIPFLQ